MGMSCCYHGMYVVITSLWVCHVIIVAIVVVVVFVIVVAVIAVVLHLAM